MLWCGYLLLIKKILESVLVGATIG
uniref:Uncharacterized protein n=1 Tax=Rhizophora mucronata TaxID=61149 RepID=A0A2P2KP31_RHIMU